MIPNAAQYIYTSPSIRNGSRSNHRKDISRTGSISDIGLGHEDRWMLMDVDDC